MDPWPEEVNITQLEVPIGGVIVEIEGIAGESHELYGSELPLVNAIISAYNKLTGHKRFIDDVDSGITPLGMDTSGSVMRIKVRLDPA